MKTKKELISEVAEASGLTTSDAKLAIDALGLVIQKTIARGEDTIVPGLGSLRVKTRAARTYRNPQTGGVVKAPAKKIVRFAAIAALSDAANRKKSAARASAKPAAAKAAKAVAKPVKKVAKK